jgi:hypothetical protein
VLARRLKSYEHAFELEMEPLHPQDDVLGHEDVFLYQPARVALVALRGTTDVDLLTALVAARLANAELDVFLDESLSGNLVERIAAPGASRFASARAVAGKLVERGYERLRLLEPTPGRRSQRRAVAPLVDAEPVSDTRRAQALRPGAVPEYRAPPLRQPQPLLALERPERPSRRTSPDEPRSLHHARPRRSGSRNSWSASRSGGPGDKT